MTRLCTFTEKEQRDREKETETDRQSERQTDRETETERVPCCDLSIIALL